MWVHGVIVAALHVGLAQAQASELPPSGGFSPQARSASADLQDPEALDRAEQRLERGDTAGAVALLESLSAANPSARFHRLLGRAYYRSSRWSEALDQFVAALALDPFDRETLFDIADVYLSAGLPDQAESAIEHVDALPDVPAARDPGDASWQSRYQDASFTLAETYADSGRIGKALEAMERAGSLDGPVPRPVILARIGDFATTLVRFERAEDAYREALAIDPSATGPRIALGKLYTRTNRPVDALEQYQRVLAVDATNVAALAGEAEAYLILGEVANAMEASGAAVGLDPNDRRARYVHGRALVLSGRTTEGQAELTEYGRLEAAFQDADHLERETHAVQSAAMVHLFSGDTERAVTLLEEASRHYPDVSDFRFSLGLVLSQSGRHEAAVEVFQDLLDRSGNDTAAIHRHLEREYALLGDTGASQQHRAEAERLERDPSGRITPDAGGTAR